MEKKIYGLSNVMIMTPKEFITQYENNPSEIKEATIVPPELGKPGFGKIIVKKESNSVLSFKKNWLRENGRERKNCEREV
jgi:hypothetical protein